MSMVYTLRHQGVGREYGDQILNRGRVVSMVYTYSRERVACSLGNVEFGLDSNL